MGKRECSTCAHACGPANAPIGGGLTLGCRRLESHPQPAKQNSAQGQRRPWPLRPHCCHRLASHFRVRHWHQAPQVAQAARMLATLGWSETKTDSPEEHLMHDAAHKEDGQHADKAPQRAKGRRLLGILHQAHCSTRRPLAAALVAAAVVRNAGVGCAPAYAAEQYGPQALVECTGHCTGRRPWPALPQSSCASVSASWDHQYKKNKNGQTGGVPSLIGS
jgi:hypothetical protein